MSAERGSWVQPVGTASTRGGGAPTGWGRRKTREYRKGHPLQTKLTTYINTKENNNLWGGKKNEAYEDLPTPTLDLTQGGTTIKMYNRQAKQL